MDNKSTSDMFKYSGKRFTSYLRYPLSYGVKTIIFGMLQIQLAKSLFSSILLIKFNE